MHLRKHTGDMFKCPDCAYETVYKGDLNKHLRKHTGNMLKCPHCPYETAQKGHLNYHLRKHTGKMLKCSKCPYETAYKGQLNMHLRKHTGDMLKCPDCSYETLRKYRLKETSQEAHKRINRLRASHTLLVHGYLMEDLLVPECELCHSHAMTVKHLVTDSVNLANLRLRFFDGSNPNTLKQILEKKGNSNPIKIFKESNI